MTVPKKAPGVVYVPLTVVPVICALPVESSAIAFTPGEISPKNDENSSVVPLGSNSETNPVFGGRLLDGKTDWRGFTIGYRESVVEPETQIFPLGSIPSPMAFIFPEPVADPKNVE